MLTRASKLRLRRNLRLKKRQMGEISAQAEHNLEHNFFKRLERLNIVRRFVAGWLLLMVMLVGLLVAQTRLLSGYYQETVPVSGGTYREGVLGQFTSANPVYATNLVDSSVAQLVFAGLLKYDENNRLVGDLAESIESNNLGDIYTVELKPDLTWHDGEPLTAADVVFTFNVIKSPDARSPLQSAWQDVRVSSSDEHTVMFRLPNPLASFPHSLTTGIVPQHILEDVPAADMRTADFNTAEPIGSGPFVWRAIEVEGAGEAREERIALAPFEDYNGGTPSLNSFVMRTFRTPERLADAFVDRDVDAVAGLNSVPEGLQGNPNIRVNNMILTAEVMSFFRNNQEILKDVNVRRALVRAVDRIPIMRNLSYPTIAVNEPLLYGQLGYDPKLKQLPYSPAKARQILSKQGWKVGDDGIRQKRGQPLSFSLHTLDNKEYSSTAEQLKNQWREVGADVNVVREDQSALQDTLAYHSYDALLYGIAIGPDPDVYVYWHSSQADPRLASRLNFSEYDSAEADTALEDARTRLNRALRAAKLQPFLKAWRSDAPALGLYQPRFLYITRGEVHGLTTSEINSGPWRFINVENWMVRETRQTPEFD